MHTAQEGADDAAGRRVCPLPPLREDGRSWERLDVRSHPGRVADLVSDILLDSDVNSPAVLPFENKFTKKKKNKRKKEKKLAVKLHPHTGERRSWISDEHKFRTLALKLVPAQTCRSQVVLL